MSAGTVAELEITGLAAGGDGVARLDALAVFVPRTAVGDLVLANVVNRARFARGTVLEVVRASADRVEPPCVHYTRDGCGGCQWQHLNIDAQREAKAQLVMDAFTRIARVPIERPVVLGSDEMFGYRRTLSFTVRGNAGQRRGGFHAANAPDVIVPIGRCLLANADVQSAWDVLRRHLALLPRVRTHVARSENDTQRQARRRRDGREVHDDLRVTIRRFGEGDIAVIVEGGSQWRPDAVAELATLVPSCRAVWWKPEGRDTRLVWDRTASAVAGGSVHDGSAADASTRDARSADAQDTDDLTVDASFVQVNQSVAELLHAHVLSVVREASPAHVIDAYAGSGRLSLTLAAEGVRVTAIERDPRASAYTQAQLPPESRALVGEVEARLAEALPAGVIVLNPPRGGVDEAVTELLTLAARGASPPRLLVYVSCDPATLARDVARLPGWRVTDVRCFDMFPQTSHVETVCLLRPEA